MRRIRVRAALAVAALAAVGMVIGSGIASAHVTVDPKTATAGSYATLTFKVPTESDTASTTTISVALPTDHPFASVSVRPVPGWTVAAPKVTLPAPVTEGRITIDEAVTTVTWTATADAAIAPGQFQEFELSVGPVPQVASLSFPATQTYSDGTVVRWDQAPSGDHPAPTLTVTAAAGQAAGATTDTTARVLGAVGILLGALAVLIAAVGLRRRRPAPAAAPEPGGERDVAASGTSR